MADRDLFGHEVIYPMKAEQLPLFHEPNPAPAIHVPGETAEDRRIARKFADTPTAEMFPTETNEPEESEEEAEESKPLRQQIEEELKRRAIPYVDVNEAKRALFGRKSMEARFHFVVYSPAGSNWLLMIGEAGETNRRAMAEWEQIFGDGFKAVFAVERAAGIVFKTLAGEKLDLSELEVRKGIASDGDSH